MNSSISITLLKSAIKDLETLLRELELAMPTAKPAQARHSTVTFLEYGKTVADKEGWANGCRFARKTWPLKEDGTEYAKLQDLAGALGCRCEKGTTGSEIYLYIGRSVETIAE